jgi:benzoyl-CoA reductase/2-hydroxyglutaryl-CoA dehydratase subunit BcrC/BadD/HgdB
VAEGGLSFLSFVRAMQGNMFLPVEDQIGVLDRLIGRENRFSSGSTQNQGINSVIVSGILPPPESVISAMDGAGLRVAGNDIALLRRSYENIHEGPSDPAGYYEKFYLNHYPCPTLLYTGDQRLEKLLALIGQSGAKGVVLVGEKFCEYEYFEFPYIEKKLKEKGIHSILIEISIEDESHTSAHMARIEAFAEMIKN